MGLTAVRFVYGLFVEAYVLILKQSLKGRRKETAPLISSPLPSLLVCHSFLVGVLACFSTSFTNFDW